MQIAKVSRDAKFLRHGNLHVQLTNSNQSDYILQVNLSPAQIVQSVVLHDSLLQNSPLQDDCDCCETLMFPDQVIACAIASCPA